MLLLAAPLLWLSSFVFREAEESEAASRTSLLISAPAVAAQPAGKAPAEQTWGDLKGRFIFDGQPPKREKLTLNKDLAVCSRNHPLSEDLIVHPENGGLANVVIWLELKRNEKVATHPDYEKAAVPPVVDNLDCRFAPHVTVLRAGQELTVTNSDPVAHNAAMFFNRNDPQNLVLPERKPGQPVPFLKTKVTRAENLPTQISCSIHAWMKGWIVVKDHPYVAVTDENGEFTIRNLPAGEWSFRVWHEAAGFLSQVEQDGKSAEWQKGVFTTAVQPGENNLGTLKVSPKLFD